MAGRVAILAVSLGICRSQAHIFKREPRRCVAIEESVAGHSLLQGGASLLQDALHASVTTEQALAGAWPGPMMGVSPMMASLPHSSFAQAQGSIVTPGAFMQQGSLAGFAMTLQQQLMVEEQAYQIERARAENATMTANVTRRLLEEELSGEKQALALMQKYKAALQRLETKQEQLVDKAKLTQAEDNLAAAEKAKVQAQRREREAARQAEEQRQQALRATAQADSITREADAVTKKAWAMRKRADQAVAEAAVLRDTLREGDVQVKVADDAKLAQQLYESELTLLQAKDVQRGFEY